MAPSLGLWLSGKEGKTGPLPTGKKKKIAQPKSCLCFIQTELKAASQFRGTAMKRQGRSWDIEGFFCNKTQVVGTSKDYGKLKRNQTSHVNELALIYVREEARVWGP